MCSCGPGHEGNPEASDRCPESSPEAKRSTQCSEVKVDGTTNPHLGFLILFTRKQKGNSAHLLSPRCNERRGRKLAASLRMARERSFTIFLVDPGVEQVAHIAIGWKPNAPKVSPGFSPVS